MDDGSGQAIKAVLDNGGETTDRYTVISAYEIHEDFRGTPNDYYLGLRMSDDADQPNGVCETIQFHASYADMKDNPFGVKICFEDLPENVQRAFWSWWNEHCSEDPGEASRQPLGA